jgi:hypothetical protein
MGLALLGLWPLTVGDTGGGIGEEAGDFQYSGLYVYVCVCVGGIYIYIYIWDFARENGSWGSQFQLQLCVIYKNFASVCILMTEKYI